MAYSSQAGDGPPEGMAELRSDPIFLSQFLRLPLPPIDAVDSSAITNGANNHSSAASSGPAYMPASVGVPPKLERLPEITPWKSESTGKPYVDDLKTMIANMDETENFQHILPPPAFRRGDLPQATMLPTVHLWCIIQAWQPFNRLLNLEEEMSLGGYTKEGRLRGALQLSDHLPVHSSIPRAIPRQLIFRQAEGTKIRGCIIVKEPWVVSLPDLFDDKGAIISLNSASSDPASEALKETLAYMRSAKTTHVILTTYQHFVFVRCQLDPSDDLTDVQISPIFSAGDAKTSVYSALWYFCRDIAPKE